MFDKKANRRRYYLENIEKEKATSLKRYYENREKCRLSHRKWMKKNSDQQNEYRRDRYKNDPEYKLRMILRSRHTKALKRNIKNSSVKNLLGCTVPELKRHIEGQFKEGMSWDNWSYFGWHIDHIIPICSFNLSDPKQVKRAFHYTNLQPLWREQNMTKSHKII